MRRSKEDAEQTRTAILDAAECLFCDQGVASATLERISRMAGVTRGALYWHFSGKIEILNALHDRSAMPQEAIIRAAAEAGHDDPLGLLADCAYECLSLFETDERRQRLFLIMQSPVLGEDGCTWMSDANVDMFGVLLRLATQARNNGTLCPDFTPKEATVLLMSSMNGLLSEWLRCGKLFPLAKLGTKILLKQLSMLRLAIPS